jgi:hypothetical protein
MTNVGEAIALQRLLQKVGDSIKDRSVGRAYLTPDDRAYVLAISGDGAKVMHDFMAAVGHYLKKQKKGMRNGKEAEAEVMSAFRRWLSKQRLGSGA